MEIVNPLYFYTLVFPRAVQLPAMALYCPSSNQTKVFYYFKFLRKYTLYFATSFAEDFWNIVPKAGGRFLETFGAFE